MKKLLSILLVFIMLFSTVFASSAQTKLDQTKNDIKNEQKKLDDVKKEKKNTLSEIDNLDKQITNTEKNIDSLEDEIANLEKEISVAEENIAYAEKQYDVKDKIRRERLVSYYMNGTTSLWDTLITADSMSDFLYRKKLIECVNEFDKNLLKELEGQREEILALKSGLEENKIVCENKKMEAETKKLALNDTKTIRKTYLSKLTSDEKVLSDSIDKLNKQADDLIATINAASSTGTKYTGGTMAWPLPGFYYISSPFGNRIHPVLKTYKMHTGVDIAGSGCNGKNVVAAADGKVITAGWISGYGNTVVIDHGGGITTLYGHSQKLLVKVGQQVKRGDPIMLVGMTGYATGPHLHFEVRVNGKYVNPLDGYIKK